MIRGRDRGKGRGREFLFTGSLSKLAGLAQTKCRLYEIYPDLPCGRWEPKYLDHLAFPTAVEESWMRIRAN